MKELSVVRFKDLVEEGLKKEFGRHGEHAKLAGQLSIYPHTVGTSVTSDELEYQCEYFSKELRDGLQIKTHLAVSAEGHPEHIYLIPDERYKLPDIIVDTTIGQYVRGHTHTFVGTRDELKGVLLHQTGKGKPYELYEPSILVDQEEVATYMEPNKFFLRKWGLKSKKVST